MTLSFPAIIRTRASKRRLRCDKDMPITNKETERVLRNILKRQGYKLLNKARTNGQTGVDIKAEKGRKKWFIEVIGYKKSGPARSKDFFEVFFRAVSRLKSNEKHIVIALPKKFLKGWEQRVAQYNIAWHRIAKTFPELEIWFVDVSNKKLELKKLG